MSKEIALNTIKTLVDKYDIRPEDLQFLFRDCQETQRNSRFTLSKVFAYLGGTLFLAGIIALISMFWSDLNSFSRVLMSLGSGFLLYLFAVVAAAERRLDHVSAALSVVAVFLETTGLFVLYDEYFQTADGVIACIVIFAALCLQQSCTFLARQKTNNLFFSLMFGGLVFISVCHELQVDYEFTILTLGASYLCAALRTQRTKHSLLAAPLFFIGSICSLWAAFDLLDGSPIEFVYVGLAAALVYLSVVVKSRTLLTTSTLSLFTYVVYFTLDNLLDFVGWPIALMFIGLVFFGMSSLALRLQRNYITKEAGRTVKEN